MQLQNKETLKHIEDELKKDVKQEEPNASE
jgi:hypothetical protein